MPKTKTVQIDVNLARELEKFVCSDISGWSEDAFHIAALAGNSDTARAELNGHFADLCPLVRKRDAIIEAFSSGRLSKEIFDEYAPKLVREALNELPQMNVPEGTLAYFSSKIAAAQAAETLLAA